MKPLFKEIRAQKPNESKQFNNNLNSKNDLNSSSSTAQISSV